MAIPIRPNCTTADTEVAIAHAGIRAEAAVTAVEALTVANDAALSTIFTALQVIGIALLENRNHCHGQTKALFGWSLALHRRCLVVADALFPNQTVVHLPTWP